MQNYAKQNELYEHTHCEKSTFVIKIILRVDKL
jgi:hypothetical protein